MYAFADNTTDVKVKREREWEKGWAGGSGGGGGAVVDGRAGHGEEKEKGGAAVCEESCSTTATATRNITANSDRHQCRIIAEEYY